MSMTDITIVHHKANRDDHNHPPNTLAAIRACLEAGVDWIEIDVTALKDGADYLLTHDDVLEHETSGTGRVDTVTVDQARTLTIKDRPDYPAALLSDVVALFSNYDTQTRLQLDFKNVYPFSTDAPLLRFLDIVEPLGERVHVSSPADWQLRRLKHFAPWLDVGFEIMFYFDLRSPKQVYDPPHPPYLLGAFGYYDDSLLAREAIWTEAAYLRDRCTTLLHQVPGISTLYVHHKILARSLDADFNWAQAAQAADVKLSTWTLDVDNPVAVANAPRLRDAGVIQFTSNTPLALAKLLSE